MKWRITEKPPFGYELGQVVEFDELPACFDNKVEIVIESKAEPDKQSKKSKK